MMSINNGEAYLCLTEDGPNGAKPEHALCPRAHSFTSLISTVAGEQWRLVSEGIYTHALPAGANPPDEKGRKIRLSVYPAFADDVIRRAIPVVVEAGCPFKVISNTALLELAFSKNSSNGSSAEFLTIYPTSEEIFNELTAKLEEPIREIKAVRLPPDAAKTSGRPSLNSENPWPGLDFFLADERGFFHGREQEQNELARNIERGTVAVLVGPAAVGKSSLLRAGLKWFFERTSLEPIYLHLSPAGGVHPLQQVRDAVNGVLRERKIEGDPFGEGQNLREYFSPQEPGWLSVDKKPVTPVLIFDAFEEALAVNDSDAAVEKQFETFWRQFANLVEERPPGPTGRTNRSSAPPQRAGCKVVISLRQDDLSKLQARGGQVPAITRNHFSLKPFDGVRALEAVLGSGRPLLDQNNTEAVAEKIVRLIARETPTPEPVGEGGMADQPLDRLGVEPALLSFFCAQLNEARRRAEPKLITAQLVEAESERIVEDFFRRTGKVRVATPLVRPLASRPQEKAVPEPAHVADRAEIFQAEPPPVPVEVAAPVIEIPTKESPTPIPAAVEVRQEAAEVIPAELPRPVPPEEPAAPLPVVESFRQKVEEAKAVAPNPEAVPKKPAAVEPQPIVSPQPAKVEEARLVAPIPEVAPKETPPAPTPQPTVATEAPKTDEAKPRPRRNPKSRPKEPTPTPSTTQPPQLVVLGGHPEAEEPKLAIARRLSANEVLNVQRESYLVRRLRFLAYGICLLMCGFLAVLFFLYLQQVQKQQTEVELQEYISNLAAARNTFKSVNKKLSAAETDLAAKDSNLRALAQRTREREAEAESERERSLRMAGEQTNYEARIAELNRDKAQTEARLAQWTSLFIDLTNQIANLSRQTAELQVQNAMLTATNKAIASNPVQVVRLPAQNPAPTSNPAVERQAAAMAIVPARLPSSMISSARREVDVLVAEGQCQYSENGIKFQALRAHDALYEGAVVRTGPGSWTDFFVRRTGTTVRLGPESQLKLTKLWQESENGVPVMDTVIELRNGRIFTAVRALVPGSSFEITDSTGQSVIEGGGLGCFMISTGGPDMAGKLILTPLRVASQIGPATISPGQTFNAKGGPEFSLVPSSWETTLVQLDELENETDKAIAEPQRPASTTQK